MEIIPAILANSTADFEQKIQSELMDYVPWVHIDIMNGTFTAQSCVSHPSLVPESFHPRIELHLMVNNPIEHMETWLSHPAFSRAIVHVEAQCDIAGAILYAKECKKEITLAINPQTPEHTLAPYMEHVKRLLIMGVIPGASGQPFFGEPVLKRIRDFRTQYPNCTLAIDGGITSTNIVSLQKAGAHTICTASAIWQKDVSALTAYKRLTYQQLHAI